RAAPRELDVPRRIRRGISRSCRSRVPRRNRTHARPRVTYGGIEAGGTKWVCAIGDGPDDLHELATIPTTTPAETLGAATGFFQQNGKIAGIGVGSFGPVDLERGSITTTPKAGWAN